SQTASTGTLTFSQAPAISPTGELTYTATDNTSGTATFSATLGDDGSPAETSLAQSFTITVNSTNAVPSFVIAGDPATISEDAGLQTVTTFATNIRRGPSPSEDSQNLTFNITQVSSTGNLAFSQAPSISAFGTLTYTTAANTNGAATFSVTLSDDGVPVATSAAQTFTITVNAVNDAPSFNIGGSPPAISEDAGLQTISNYATAISKGGNADEDSQSLTFNVTQTFISSNLAFSTPPSISETGELTYEVAANASGLASFSVTLSDNGTPVATSAAQSFSISVNAVNDPPVFTLAANPPASDEDAPQQAIFNFITDIGPGAANEVPQFVTFNLTQTAITGNLAFTQNPTVASTGLLLYRAAPNTNGTVTYSITATDDGTPAATSSAQTFTITVNAVNDKPTFTLGTSTSDEDAGLITIPNFVTNLVMGGTDESGQVITNYAVTKSGQISDGVSFTTEPAISTDGTLTYQAAPDDNGTVFFSVIATDNGIPSAESDQVVFSIVVDPVNDEPVFTLSSTSVTVDEDAGAQSFFPIASRSAGGSSDEFSQTTTFTVTQVSSTGNLTFVNPPNAANLTNSNSLTFEASPNTNGSATFELVLTDDGTPARATATQTITINVTAVNDAPTFNIAANPAVISEDAGLQTIANFATAIDEGGIADEDSQLLTFNLTQTASSGNLIFSAAPSISATGELTYSAVANTNGTANFSVTLSDDGTPVATSAAQTFTITVNSMNDVPVFAITADPATVNEDAGLQTIANFATGISAGSGTDEAAQNPSFNITETSTTGNLAFATAPAISATGELTYSAAANTNGTAIFSVTLSDDGMPVATSAAQTFTITVNAVNDIPVFTIASDPATINEDAGLQTIANFATAIDEGGSTDEDSQTLTFNVTQTTSTGNLAFANVPTISESGELTYSAAANTNGTATFSVTLSDDGTPVATSAAQTFTITV
ncbi:MAG: Ig-like domain-containing protein, partial [Cyclobacteriaceae bacterium]